MRPTPREFFTREYAQSRTVPPPVLFHFTPFEHAVMILQAEKLVGHPTISFTENPAMHYTPGPVAIIVMRDMLTSLGYKLWPYVWNREWREAEWVLASKDSQQFEWQSIVSEQVSVPVAAFYAIGYPPSWDKKFPERVGLLSGRGPAVVPFCWEEWWK